MKSNKYIFVSIVGILSVLFLQAMWIRQTVLYTETNMVEDINKVVVKSMFSEVYKRFIYVPAETRIAGAPDLSTPKFQGIEYIEEGVFNATHKDINYRSLGEFFQKNIQAKGWDYAYIIYKVEAGKKTVVAKSNSLPSIISNKISSQYIPVRINKSIGIQVELLNPINLFFKQLGLIILSSFIIGMFILLCVVKLYKAIRLLQEAARVKKEFTYSMIHDIKTPLSTIQLSLTALNNKRVINNEEKRTKYLNVINAETQHAYQLIHNILTISKSESKKLELHKETVDLSAILSRIENNFITNHQKIITFENQLNCPNIYADIEYLKEIFYNLIDNSVKYSDKAVTIRVSSERVNKGVVIRFWDNGFGIKKDDQKIIFDKFERASASNRMIKKGGASGFGMGLTYVFQVIDAHHGMVTVDSELGKYTEFTIFLPDQDASNGGGEEGLDGLYQ